MYRKNQTGVTVFELMISVAVLAGMLATAVPNYSKFIEKRRTSGAVEMLHSYIEGAKMESIKRNQPVTVRFRNTYDGAKWCFGAELGTEACDCAKTDPGHADYCDISGVGTKLWFSEFEGVDIANIDLFDDGSKTFTFDPVRGLLTNTNDSGSFDLVSAGGDYMVTVSINGAGRVRECTNPDNNLSGYDTCS